MVSRIKQVLLSLLLIAALLSVAVGTVACSLVKELDNFSTQCRPGTEENPTLDACDLAYGAITTCNGHNYDDDGFNAAEDADDNDASAGLHPECEDDDDTPGTMSESCRAHWLQLCDVACSQAAADTAALSLGEQLQYDEYCDAADTAVI